jgi:16S rRNA C1402 (ribose-2'-O) methylase RsmI
MATCLLKRRKKASFKTLERISFEKTNLQIETPYRNNKLLEDLMQSIPKRIVYCYGHYFTYRIHQIKNCGLEKNHRFAQTPHNFHHVISKCFKIKNLKSFELIMHYI